MSSDSISTIVRAAQALKSNQSKKNGPPATAPSRRSQEIFHRVFIDCQRQSDVAKQLGITPSRVSQIVRRVRHWLACSAGVSPAEAIPTLNSLERRRLDYVLAQARHQAIYENLMREVTRQIANPQHTTIRTEAKPHDCPADDSLAAESSPPVPTSSSTPRSALPAPHSASEITKRITTVRDQPLNVQLLKAAHRSALELERLAERDPLPDPEPEIPSDDTLYSAIFDVLYDMRRRAEQEGRTVKSTNLYQLVNNCLSALLGREQGTGGGFFDLDDSIRQLVRRFVIKPIAVTPHNPEPEQFLADMLVGATAGLSSSVLGEHGQSEEPAERLAPHSHPLTPQPLTPAPPSLAPPPATTTANPALTSDNPVVPAPRPNSSSSQTKKIPDLTPPPRPRPAPVVFHLFTAEQLASVCDPWTRDY